MRLERPDITRRPAIARSAKPPILILGGTYNALSILRGLGSRGVDIYLSTQRDEPVCHSRYITGSFPVPDGCPSREHWGEILLSGRDSHLQGSVLFPCNDAAVEFVSRHHVELARNFILEDSAPEVRLAMLDKERTLALARNHGIPIPNFWPVASLADLEPVLAQVQYPAIVKPHHSHLFQARFEGRRFFFIADADELRRRAAQVIDAGLGFMVSEFIPGPDTQGSSSYTYLDGQGSPLFHLTKSTIRRKPVNAGAGCYHITTWEPDTIEQGRRFLTSIGFRGVAHLDFKRDLRDRKLKLMECNPRFTAPQELLTRAGIDVPLIVYNHLVGLPAPNTKTYRVGMRLWFPVEDYASYRELRASGQMTFPGWVQSLLHPLVIPDLSLRDPKPMWKLLTRETTRRRARVRRPTA